MMIRTITLLITGMLLITGCTEKSYIMQSGLEGIGTPDTLAKYTSPNVLASSSLSDSAQGVSIAGNSNTTGNASFVGPQFLLNGVQFQTNYSTRPDCDPYHRGWVWFTYGGLGVKDTIDVCEKSALDTYTWVGIG